MNTWPFTVIEIGFDPAPALNVPLTVTVPLPFVRVGLDGIWPTSAKISISRAVFAGMISFTEKVFVEATLTGVVFSDVLKFDKLVSGRVLEEAKPTAMLVN